MSRREAVKPGYSKFEAVAPKLKHTHRKLCPDTNKRGYNSKGVALRAAVGFTATYGQSFKAYQCECGKWHLSTVKP